MGRGLIPDRWLEYSPIGAQIEGTRFIAFKVPLDNLDLNATKDAQGIDVDVNNVINTKLMFERIPNLGLVIDLTNTKKYYNPENVTDLGIEYKKIFVPGQSLPSLHIYEQFMGTVTDFLRRNSENDKLIGVHCTHGLNRTGLMICAHMIQKCNIPPVEAIARFDAARGHKMERENYLNALRRMTANMQLNDENHSNSDLILHDDGNRRTIATQTNTGLWLDKVVSKNSRKRKNEDITDDVKDVRGTVYVDGSKLISDDCGGFYMKVELSDIRPIGNRSRTHTTQRHYPSFDSNGGNGTSQHYHPAYNYQSEQYRSSYQSRYPSDRNVRDYADRNERFSKRNTDSNDRRINQSYYQQNFRSDSYGPFKF